MENSDKLMVLVNLALCLGGGFVCVCRMGMMTGQGTKWVIRLEYQVLCMLFVLSGGSYWLWQEVPTWAQLAFGVGVLVKLVLGWPAWRYGPPAYTFKEPV